jgi:hypothetical protein
LDVFILFLYREEKRLRRKEEALLRELRIFLRDIWAKINRESKFFMFRLVIKFFITGILTVNGRVASAGT